MEYKENDYVLVDGSIEQIKSTEGTKIIFRGKECDLEGIKPILIEDEMNLIIRTDIVPMASLIGDGKGHRAPKPLILTPKEGSFREEAGLNLKDIKRMEKCDCKYWKIPEDMKNKSFFFEKRIKYVHEFQRYLKNDSPGMCVNFIDKEYFY